MKLKIIQDALRRQGLTLFSSQEFRRACGLTEASAKFLLIRYVKKGWILRLKARRGLYALDGYPPDPWQVANRLVRPSCISLATALSFHGIIPETVSAVTSVSPQSSRTFQAMGRTFIYQKIKAAAFRGYRAIQRGGRTVYVAAPEKALADYLYLAFLKRGPSPDRLRLKNLRPSKVLQELAWFGRPGLLRWAKGVLRP